MKRTQKHPKSKCSSANHKSQNQRTTILYIIYIYITRITRHGTSTQNIYNTILPSPPDPRTPVLQCHAPKHLRGLLGAPRLQQVTAIDPTKPQGCRHQRRRRPRRLPGYFRAVRYDTKRFTQVKDPVTSKAVIVGHKRTWEREVGRVRSWKKGGATGTFLGASKGFLRAQKVEYPFNHHSMVELKDTSETSSCSSESK